MPGISRRAVAAALLLAALSGWTAERRYKGHRVYFDEFEHVNIAQNLARLGAYGESLAGGTADFDVLDRPTWPGGAHVVWSWVYRAGGSGERAASLTNVLLASGSVLLCFLLGARVFSDAGAGLLAAAAWAFLPLRLEFAATTELTAPSTFWLAASLLSALAFSRSESKPLRILAILIPCYAAHVRFENGILLGLALAQAPRRKLAWVAAAVVAIPVAMLVWLNRAQALPGFDPGLAASAGSLWDNLGGNISFLFQAPVGLLLIYGLYAALRIEKARPLLLVALSYLIVYSGFFRGDFHGGTERRYALSVLLPLLVAASAGLASRLSKRAIHGVALGVAVFFLAWHDPVDRGVYALDEIDARGYATLLPKGTTVVAYSVPFILATTARPAVSPYLLLDPESPAAKRALESPQLALWKDGWWKKRAAVSRRVEALLRERFEIPDQDEGMVTLRRKKGA